jgi:outer membrane protein assembly factor BamB
MPAVRKVCLLIASLSVLLAPALGLCQLNTNAPWPMFHHDLRHTGKTPSFGTQIGKLKWRVVTAGPVTSSPAIDENGIIYVGSADNNIYAINGETGVIEWKYKTGGPINHSSPAIDIDGTVYIGSYDGYLYAFNTATIDPDNSSTWVYKWRFLTDGPGAIASSPAIAPDGSVIFGCADGKVYAVNPNGTLKWKNDIGMIMTSSSAIDTANSQVYIGTTVPPVFYTLDLQTGAVVWSYDLLCGGVYSSAAIASNRSVIFSNFTTYYSANTCLNSMKFQIYNFSPTGGITPDITETAPNWKLDLKNDIYTTPAILEDNNFFVGSGSVFYRINQDGQIYFAQSIDGQRIESSAAIDGAKFIYVGTNGGRFYCLNADRPEPQTTIVWQYPPNDQPALAASILSSPAIGNDARHSIYVGGSDNSVYAFYDGIRISGTVKLVEDVGVAIQKTPLPAVKITLTGENLAEEKITFTDPDGFYEFAGLENGTYKILPERQGYIFNPETLSVTVKDQDINNANFEAFSGFTISGTIRDKNGQPMSGVSIAIDGLKSSEETTLTDGTGFYKFTGLGFDTFTITPFYEGYGFTPPFQEVTIASTDTDKNKPDINFTGSLGFQISGKVSDIDGQGLQGVTITMTGGPQNISLQTQTNQDGAYSFVELQSGTYTITPSLGSYDFNPVSKTITIASASVFNVDFVAAIGANISGYVLEGSTPLKDVTVNLITATTKQIVQTANTDTTGFYVFLGVLDGSYEVKPLFAGYGFDPAGASVIIRNTDVTDVNFRAVKGLYITGTVSNLLNMPLKDVTLELTNSACNSSCTANTNASGYYSFLGLEPDIYTVTVSTPGYLSFPSSQVVDLASEGKDNINFKMYPTCPMVLVNIPFYGGKGTIVNIFGINFGMTEPSESLVADFNGTTVPAGVYFGTSDVSTWVKAEVLFWSPVKILVKAPAASGFGIARVWVINDKGCIYVNPALTNFFVYGF